MTLPHPSLVNWQIPPHFKVAPSAVEGITVFAPIPVEEDSGSPTEYKCPNCGATTQFDISSGEVACEHCGYKSPVKAARVGLNASVFEFTLEALNQSERGWGVERQELACQSCGAALSVEVRAITTTCPFCGSNEINLRAAVGESLRPRFIIPFRIKNEQLAAQTHEWLGKGWFHPSELASQVGLDRFMGIYLPYWTFNAVIASDWKAEVGYERQVSHYNSETKTQETHTEIDWRWENGHARTNINDLLIPGTGRLSRSILERISPFNLADLMTYSPDYLAGWKALGYDVSLQPAWDDGKRSMREHAKDACYQQISTSHVRNFNMSADFSDESWRYVLLPVYIASYQFEQKTFQVMVNGQSGQVAGQKPVAWWKVWLAVAGLLSPGALLVLIGLPLLLLGGFGIIPIIIGGILFIAGLIISGIIYNKAAASEAV
jgi:DNA-directed RNA polymerase subunit RPC12/RpoP